MEWASCRIYAVRNRRQRTPQIGFVQRPAFSTSSQRPALDASRDWQRLTPTFRERRERKSKPPSHEATVVRIGRAVSIVRPLLYCSISGCVSRTISWTRLLPPHPLITRRCALIGHGCALSHIGALRGMFPTHFRFVRVFALCGLTKGCCWRANKSTVRPLKPVFSSDQEHEQDPDTTLVESTFSSSSLIASKKRPHQPGHACNSVDDFWKKIAEEQDDTPLDLKHLVLDLQDNGVRLFVRPLLSWPPPLASSVSLVLCLGLGI